MTVRVVILDDHKSYSQALASGISSFDGVESVGVTSSILEFLELCLMYQPTVALIDDRLSEASAAYCAGRLRREGIRTRMLLMSSEADVGIDRAALDAGFEQVLTKHLPLANIVDVIRFGSP